jgi:hypothetical protein
MSIHCDETAFSMSYWESVEILPRGEDIWAVLFSAELHPAVYKISLPVWCKGYLLLSIQPVNGGYQSQPYEYLKPVANTQYETISLYIFHEAIIEPLSTL